MPLTLDLLDAGAKDPSLLALSFDAYAAVGSSEAQRLARRTRSAFEAGRRLPSELVTLRCALFMEQRGAHHRGEPMDGPYVTALVRAMRRAVAGGGTQVMDGDAALRSLARAAGYPSLCHLLASQTVFLQPETVRQANGRATFPVVRGHPRGERTRIDDQDVILDDNTTPTLAFLWAADRRPGRDVQYNHVWPNQGRNPATYTALWNLCVTPASLAKLTDGTTHPDTVGLLQYRAFDLYGCVPDGIEPPGRPERYDELEPLWHPMPQQVDLEAALRMGLAAKPSSRAAQAAREIGWLFSDGPDEDV